MIIYKLNKKNTKIKPIKLTSKLNEMRCIDI